ncbi:F-box protein VBF-like isoform X2 [Papaver somniferum]|uniref:F-box protein VBF-like isoform X2 n=1 Tax=Papaver somniferum TaxID=3469 RepID=UPI000E700B56|nr:F-box protein VBF-like isoform X2 [Papaver somniferum]
MLTKMGSEEAILFDLNSLPEGCISTILSLTSPVDACKSSVVSSTFRMASDSDVVWERFLPSDYKQILLRSVYSTHIFEFLPKKELYLRLRREPVMLDNGTKYMLGARELSIADGNNPLCWGWKLAPESRFSEVIILRSITNLKIRGKIKTSMLSPETTYAAYLIVKFEEWAYGLDSIPSELLLGENDGNSGNKGFAYLSRANDKKKQQMKQLFFVSRMQMMRSKVIMGDDQGKEMRVLRDRNDGWMEIELGEIYISEDGKSDHNKEVKMSLMEVKGGHIKGGLIVQGIEVRPKLRWFQTTYHNMKATQI